MKKTTIELDDGKVYDCGVEELKNLKQAIKEGDSKKVVLATVRLLQSSDSMMDELTQKIIGVMDNIDNNAKERVE